MLGKTFKKYNKVSIVDKAYLFVVFSLIALLTYVMFVSREGFGSGELHGVGRIVLAIVLLLAVYLINNIKYLTGVNFFTGVVLFWIPCAFLSCINNLIDVSFAEYIVTVSKCLLWCFVYLFFYIFFRKNPKVLFVGNAYFFAIAVFSSVAFFYIYSFTNKLSTVVYYQLNDVFYILLTLPWLISVKNLIWRQFGFCLVGVIVLFSMKRSAFIIFLFAMVVYLLIGLFKSRKKTKKLVCLSAVILSACTGFVYFNQSTGGYLIHRLGSSIEDQGSGRIQIYEEVLRSFADSGLVNLIIGHGYNNVVTFTSAGLSAHNDFLEVLFDFGLLGFSLYLFMHILILKKTISLFFEKHFYAGPFAVSFVIFFLMSMVSHLIIYPTYFLFLVAFWGGIFGSTDSVVPCGRSIH